MEHEEAEDQPVYLRLLDALELYAAIITVPTAQAADQLRHRGGLESVLARPQSHAQYQDADLTLDASDPEPAEWIISLSAGATPAGLAELMRARLRPS